MLENIDYRILIKEYYKHFFPDKLLDCSPKSVVSAVQYRPALRLSSGPLLLNGNVMSALPGYPNSEYFGF